MNRSGLFLEARLAEIASFTVEPHSQLGSTSGVGKFNMDVIPVDRLFEEFDRLLGSQPGFQRMITLAKAIYQTLFGRFRIARGWWRWRVPGQLLHFLPQAERP